MDYKLNFITRLFQKIANKRFEYYVISRVWHLLNNPNIKVLPQQYIARENDKFALTDLYFPQFNYHLEINEEAHYYTEEKKSADDYRQQEIEDKTQHKVFVVDCREDMQGIHRQIDEFITIIRALHKEQLEEGIFKPWNPEEELNPFYWKSKGRIEIADEISLPTIEDICHLFEADYQKTKRGFMRKGGINSPKYPEYHIWWPSERPRSGWVNQLSEDRKQILVSHKNKDKQSKVFQNYAKTKEKRIVFFQYKDILGDTNYKFVGAFENDQSLSTEEKGVVWVRSSDCFSL